MRRNAAGGWAPALLGPVLRNRGVTLGLTAACVAQAALVALRLPGWPCPVRSLLGVPCPGCGMSRAVVALVHGEWARALRLHAFAPVALVVLALVAAAALLPARGRDRLAALVTRVESSSGLTVFLAAALFLYWLFRLLYTPPTLDPPG